MSFYIAGAGGFGRETLDAVMARGESVAAFLDDHKAGRTVRGLPVIRPDEVSQGKYVVAIADPHSRREFAYRLDSRGLTALAVIHPHALIGPDTIIGEGTVILANTYVSSSITIGRHVQISYNSTIGHDSVLKDYTTMYPGANVAGDVLLSESVTMGSNSCVIQGLTVGAQAVVGAGAVVVRNVESNTVVKGVPAR